MTSIPSATQIEASWYPSKPAPRPHSKILLLFQPIQVKSNTVFITMLNLIVVPMFEMLLVLFPLLADSMCFSGTRELFLEKLNQMSYVHFVIGSLLSVVNVVQVVCLLRHVCCGAKYSSNRNIVDFFSFILIFAGSAMILHTKKTVTCGVYYHGLAIMIGGILLEHWARQFPQVFIEFP